MDGFSSKGVGRGKIRQLLKQEIEEKSRMKSIVAETVVNFASKPEPGTSGREAILKTNYFKMNIALANVLLIHHYDVIIERLTNPSKIMVSPIPAPSRKLKNLEKKSNRFVCDQMCEQNSGVGQLFYNILPVYDGDKNLFVSKKLDEEADEAVKDLNGSIRFCIHAVIQECEEGREENYTLRLKHVGVIKIDPTWSSFPQNALQFLDVALRYGTTVNKISIVNKVFEASPTKRYNLSPHMELSFGFLQSARNTENGLMLNVDRASCVFHKEGNLAKMFGEKYGINIPNVTHCATLMTKELKGLKVKVNHLKFPMKLRIMECSQKSAAELNFQFEEKDESGKVISVSKTSVADYFERYYAQLKYPYLPCLVVGSEEKPCYYPMEVCDLIPDQYVSNKMSPSLSAKMTRISSGQSPGERFEKIREAVLTSVLEDGDQYLQEFGIDVDGDLLEVKGRILTPPTLKCGNSSCINPEKTGEWSLTKPARCFERPIDIKRWVLAELTLSEKFVCGAHFMGQFQGFLISAARRNGIVMSPARKIIELKFKSPEDVRSLMEAAVRNVPDLQLIIFMIPKSDQVYATIKTLGDTVFGIPTQCVLVADFSNEVRDKITTLSYLSNLILKINPKLGGVNTVSNLKWSNEKRIMFVGVDVTHPTCDRLAVSISSCVGSYDNSFTKFVSKQCVQKQTMSDIVHLDLQMQFLFENYRKRNGGLLPNHVIVYRDGISQSQFDQVSKVEISKLKNVMKAMNMDKYAKLTYIVVQKRHNTRFIPVERGDGTPNGNVLPGTVVDRDIIDPKFFNFYICSHNSQLGTSRPAHYYVLYDENGFKPNLIQRITYDLCFSLCRCNQPISVPAPVYYAHLSAYRSRYYILEATSSGGCCSSSGSVKTDAIAASRTPVSDEFIRELNAKLTVHKKLIDRLYFV